MQLGRVVPILRSFDEAKAREFYVDFLGFAVEFEHRFDPGAPLYMGLVRDSARLHVSEHHGDASPGASVRISIDDLDALHAELAGKRYKYNRPGIEATPWGTREMRTNDPFFNRVTFVAAA